MIKDITGMRFGRWTVKQLADLRQLTSKGSGGPKAFWLCECDCGNTGVIIGSNLRNGGSKSCGCLQKEAARENINPYSQVGKYNTEHPRWKGGRIIHSSGYVLVYDPYHHRRQRGAPYVFEHIKVMEALVGRNIYRDETIHHRNGIKNDNRPENLELRAGNHGKGQSIEDLRAWAKEILIMYPEEEATE